MVQDAGQVAKHLCEYLKNAGANIFITDIVDEKITNVLKSVKAEVIKPDEIFDIEADIFSPCALG